MATKPKAPKRPVGRPTKLTPEVANIICAELSEGKSLRSVVKRDDMPSMVTVFNWLHTNPEFLNQYTRAKLESADAFADDIVDVAQKTLKGTYDPQSARVAVDAFKWTASKLKPKVYGDKLDVTTGGEKLPTPLLGGISVPKTDQDNS